MILLQIAGLPRMLSSRRLFLLRSLLHISIARLQLPIVACNQLVTKVAKNSRVFD